MIRIAIIEDKFGELEHLKSLLENTTLADFQIIEEIGTVKGAIDFFNSKPDIDLAFMDIQLPDGVSFDILKHVDIQVPIIFASSYDHYVLQAIKVNGMDYLIKPVNPTELDAAIENFLKQRSKAKTFDLDDIKAIVSTFVPKVYKSSFLVNFKHKMLLLDINDVAYCYVKEKGTFLVTKDGKEYLVDYYLDQLEDDLDPNKFYRVNRQYLMSRSSIKEIENYFNGRLLVTVTPPPSEQIIISKKRISDFKKWADT